MSRNGSTQVQFNPRYFENVLRDPKVEALTDSIASRALNAAKASAPVDEGDYKDGLHLEVFESRYRRTKRVVGGDPKTLLIESKTGNLARSLKAAKS